MPLIEFLSDDRAKAELRVQAWAHSIWKQNSKEFFLKRLSEPLEIPEKEKIPWYKFQWRKNIRFWAHRKLREIIIALKIVFKGQYSEDYDFDSIEYY